MNNESIKNIVIVGGDTVGWTAAMGLARGLQGQNVTITIINDQLSQNLNTQPSIISATDHINSFHQQMGINEQALFSQDYAKFICARQYKNWLEDKADFYIGFNTYSPAYEGLPLHQFVHYCNANEQSDYSLAAQIAINNKLLPYINKDHKHWNLFTTGVVLDTQKYGEFVKGAARHLGVNVIDSLILDVVLDEETQFVSHVILANEQTLPVDIIIDNSGSYSKIMQSVMEIEFQDTGALIPFNSMLEIRTEQSNKQLNKQPSIQLTATENGILEEATLGGFSYKKLMCKINENNQEDIAQHLLLSTGLALTERKNVIKHTLRFGHSQKFFNKNCIVIGNAAGCYSDIGISNLVLTQRMISRLLDCFPSKKCFVSTVNEFNRLTLNDYNEARDFFTLHLYLSSTNKSDNKNFWIQPKSNLSRILQQKIELFECYRRYEDELNPMIISTRWIDLLSYCCIDSIGYEPLLEALNKDELIRFLLKIKQDIAEKLTELSDGLSYN